MPWSHDEYDILLSLCSQQIKMRVYDSQAGAGSPVT